MIVIHNQSRFPFRGWKRVTVSDWPAHGAGVFPDGARWVSGRNLGIAARAVDINVDLQPGQRVMYDMMTSKPMDHDLALPPQASTDPVGYFGVPTVAGAPLRLVSLTPDGACFLAHLQTRLQMLVADLWLHIYPDQPWAPGELAITCSDVSRPDLQQVIPFDVKFAIGGATHELETLLHAGDYMGDGQRRVWPVTILWDRAVMAERDSCFAHDDVAARGLTRIGPLGVAPEQGRFDVGRWIASRTTGVEAAIYDWSSPWNIGVPANSTQTGDEEEQGYSQGFESFYEGGLPAIRVRYLAALAQAKRPCHHLEHSGQIAVPENHPNCVFWQGRPHWHVGVSPDQFSKPRALKPSDAHGWFGPDREHWLIHSTAASYELTGSPALQDELRHQANLFLFGETVDPRLSTSSTDAARSAGWTGLVVAHLWRLLEDRTLAVRVRDRWLERVKVYVRGWGGRDFWQLVPTQVTTMGVAVGTRFPFACMLYQQAVGAMGLYVAGKMLGSHDAVQLALRGAKAVLRWGYRWQADGRIVDWEIVGVNADGTACESYVEGDGAHRTGWYRTSWMVPAAWVYADAGGDSSLYEKLMAEEMDSGSTDHPLDWFPTLTPRAIE